MPTEEKIERRARIDTYAETACGCFTTLQKRAALAAASSRLVAAADPLGFFGRPPKRVGAARRFYSPPRARHGGLRGGNLQILPPLRLWRRL